MKHLFSRLSPAQKLVFSSGDILWLLATQSALGADG